jgi:alpha-L-fucosidase
MKRRSAIKTFSTGVLGLYFSNFLQAGTFLESKHDVLNDGLFKPSWESFEQYEVPEWFRDAKFGIWAHWGSQCEPERGDWYARGMYQEGSDQYNYHNKKYGHPSEFGFKDVINEWKAEEWDPEALMDLYQKAGAQYFMALANHHDNLDLYNSIHQSWNSVNLGPKKDIMQGSTNAAKKRGLRFGASVHSAHARTWFETAQRSDKTGPKKGIPYDGNLRKGEGAGKWWSGMDPQELYAQDHELSENSKDDGMIHRQWHWDKESGVNVPDKEYCDTFYKRTKELIDNYEPDILYFDDTALPLWPISRVGLQTAADLYNKSIEKNGKVEAVINGKILDEQQQECLVWDIERGQSNKIEKEPWQTCTCIGSWHYDRRIYDNNGYKSAKTVIHMLADVVSKNGNLLLSIPLRGSGAIDDKARKVVEDIAEWMEVNSESLIGTRPWQVFGEGPAQLDAAPLSDQGFNEGKGKPFTAEDIRFTIKGQNLYAIFMGWPENNKIKIKSLGIDMPHERPDINNAILLGHDTPLKFKCDKEGFTVQLPENYPKNGIAYSVKLG